MVVHLLVGALVEGDGIGNSVLAQYQMLGDLGYNCDIFVLYADDKLKSITRPITSLKADKDDLIIDHVGGYSFYARCVYKQPCRKVLCYHNITPPELVEGSMKNLCRKGLDQISKISGMYDFICGDSAFNLECLRELGEQRRGDVLPIPVDFPYKATEKTLAGGKLRFLFVGRYVENKRIEDLIRVFDYYHGNINSDSELSVIGNPSVSPSYTSQLQDMVKASSCAEAISLVGRVSDGELREYYKNSDVYLCMSEHEGFCIPLIEAMYNNLVVFAYDSAAVSDTMGEAGILLDTKDSEQVSKRINDVMSNKHLVMDILNKESLRSQFFSRENIRNMLANYMSKWASDEYERPANLSYERPRMNFRLFIMKISPTWIIPFLRRIKHAIASR